MSVSALFLVLYAIGVSVALVWVAHELKTRHQARYLDHYYHFILASVCYGMVNWVGPFLILDIARDSDPKWVVGSFIIFAIPLLFVKLGFIISLFQEMMMRNVARRAASVFIGLSTLVLIATLLVIKQYLDTGDSGFLRTYMLILGAIAVGIEFSAIGQFVVHAERGRPLAIAGASMQFGLLYFAGYLVYVTCAWSPFIGAPLFIFDLSPWIYFLVHVLPLAVLWRYHQGDEVAFGSAKPEGLDLSSVIQEFGLTPREREILAQVIGGQSNKEISDTLFISPNTVRNHIYNIYKKMGVKNRLQLVALSSSLNKS